MSDQSAIPAAAMGLPELRALRARLQGDDDAVSYVRRLAQARLDLVRAERRRRTEAGNETLSDELEEILSAHLTGGPARPPRPADDFSSHPLATELDELGGGLGHHDLSTLSDERLDAYAQALADFEQLRSHERRNLFARIDALTAELVERYRTGAADVDGLLDDQ